MKFNTIPDFTTHNVFKNLLDRFPSCPICNSPFEFSNEFNSSEFSMRCAAPYIKTSSGSWLSTKRDHSLQCNIIQTKRIHNDITYTTKQASFSISIDGWQINYYNKFPFKVYLSRHDDSKSISNNIFLAISLADDNRIKFKVDFKSIEYWFAPKEQLIEMLDKYRLLM